MSGISRRTIINYEDDQPTSPRVVKDWAAACNVTIEWILTGIEPAKPDDGGKILPIKPRKMAKDQRTPGSRWTMEDVAA